MRVIGVNSGTSVDGIASAYRDFGPARSAGQNYTWRELWQIVRMHRHCK